VAALASALSAELRSGRHPEQAWGHVVSAGVDLPGVWVPGADVVLLLRRWAQRPGWSGLGAVAVTWELANASGAGLSDALDRVAESMRHEEEVAAEVEGQLVTTKATAVVLATLPLLAVVLGSLLGADLLDVLLRTPVGWVCLALGLMLASGGSWWVAAQVTGVRRMLQWQ
jgi:tight adherence protein B